LEIEFKFWVAGSPTELPSKEKSHPNSQLRQTEGCEVKLEITLNEVAKKRMKIQILDQLMVFLLITVKNLFGE
jgi:hypothetical protein